MHRHALAALISLSLALGCSSTDDDPATGGSGGSTASGGSGGATATGGSGASGGSGGSGGSTSTGGGGSGGGVSCDDGSGWEPAFQAIECELFELIDAQRAEATTCGATPAPAVAPLTRDQLLTDAARAHAQDMAENDWFGHTDPQGNTSFDRIAASGYQGGAATAEVTMGDMTPAGMLEMIMSYELDCQNIMIDGAVALGIGYFAGAPGQPQPYWVLYFGN